MQNKNRAPRVRRLISLIIIFCATLIVNGSGVAQNNEKNDEESKNRAIIRKQIDPWYSLYRRSDHWAIKAMVLIRLSEIHHPESVHRITRVFKNSKQKMLKLYAANALFSYSDYLLRAGADRSFMNTLITTELQQTSRTYRKIILSIINRLTPEKFETRKQAKTWWANNKKNVNIGTDRTNQIETKTEKKSSPRTKVLKEQKQVRRRMIDLENNGLDLVLVLDVTHSMGEELAATKRGLSDLSRFLSGLTSNFRLGLVIYRDDVKYTQQLTSDISRVQKRLMRTRAMYGSEFPEGADQSLHATYRTMNWRNRSRKAVILTTDAPSHNRSRAVEFARKAKKPPESKRPENRKSGPPDKKTSDDASKGTDQKNGKMIPIVTSCIDVATRDMPRKARQKTENTLKAISRAGGGTYTRLGKQGKIIKQILKNSFPDKLKPYTEKFVDWTYQFKKRGFW